MKVAIIGSGAMGCRFGVMLFNKGHEVLLVDRWVEHLDNIKTKGLEVVDERGTHYLQIDAALPEDAQGQFDLLILLTKSMQSEEIISDCLHLVNDETYVLTLQNGVGNIEILEKFFPSHQILAGVTTYATELLGPGKVQMLGSGDSLIMQADGKESETVKKLTKELNDAGMRITLSADTCISIWEKLAFNCVLNTLCTLTQSPVGQVGSYKDIDEVINPIVDEVTTVAHAEEIYISKDSILKMIKTAIEPSQSGHHIPSMMQDVLNGRQTEIDYINGAVVRIAKKHHLSVPNNQLITHLIKMLEGIRKKIIRFKEERK